MVRSELSWVISISLFAVVSSSLVPVAELFPPKPYKFGYAIKDKHGEQYREEAGDGLHDVKGSYGFVDDRGIKRQVKYVADKGGFRAEVHTNEPGTAPQDPASVKMISTAPLPVKEAASEEKLSLTASEFEKIFKKAAEKSQINFGLGESSAKEYFWGKQKSKSEEAKEDSGVKELKVKLALEELAKLGLYLPYLASKDIPFSPASFEKKNYGLTGLGYISPEEFAISLLRSKEKYGLNKEFQVAKDPRFISSSIMSQNFDPSSYKEKAALYNKRLEKKDVLKGIALSSASGKNPLAFVPIY